MKRLPPVHLPPSLSIALWLVAALWIVAIAAYALNAPREIVHAAFAVGLLCGAAEWIAIRGTRR
jgi:hypothetical protein